jgi:hypothetical protein
MWKSTRNVLWWVDEEVFWWGKVCVCVGGGVNKVVSIKPYDVRNIYTLIDHYYSF